MSGDCDDPAAVVADEALVRRIHDAGTCLVLAATGGGSGAIARLLKTPGASRSVLEAVVPYSEPALIDWLSGRPDQFCAEPTARAMAMAAYLRASRWMAGSDSHARWAGASCTASLVSDRPKRGPHRVHVAFQTADATASWSVELVKNRRTRAEEERVASRLFLKAIARACGLREQPDLELKEDEPVAARCVIASRDWQNLLAGRSETVRHGESPGHATQRPCVVFPGAFNPIHRGHRRMAEIAQQKLGAPVEFEISVINVEKPPLDFIEVDHRLKQFTADEAVWLTRAATFEEKSVQFPGATFVVGADTMRRIADTRYHGRDWAAWRAAMERIAARGCRFLVFARREGDRFVGLGDLRLPPPLKELCREVPFDEFHDDVSSTEIRSQSG